MRQLLTILMFAGFLTACSEVVEQQQLPETVDNGTSLSQARQTGQAELRVLFAEAEGFASHNQEGEVVGVTADIMREFVQWVERYNAIDIEVEFELVDDWQAFYQRVKQGNGGVFGLGNVTITEPRKKELQFSPPYMNNLAVLITHERVNELNTLADPDESLLKLQPLVFEGTLHEDRVRQLHQDWHPEKEVVTARTNPEIIRRVSEGAYYSYIDAYNYWRAVEQGAPLIHHPVASDDSEQFGIIMPYSNDWAALLAGFFAANGGFTSTQRYHDIMEHHLGPDLAAILTVE